MSTNFISSKDSDETRYLRTKSNNIEIMMGNETDEIIDELFEYFFTKLSKRFRRINERKQFNFCSFYLLYYHLQKISLKRGGSHIHCKSKLDYTSFKDNQLIFRYFDCKNNYKNSL